MTTAKANPMRVNILDKEYLVACPDNERDALFASAEFLSQKMKEIRDSGKIVGADRIAVMAEGEIRQVGAPAEIIENPADDYVRAFFRDVQPGRLFTAGDIAVPGEAGAGGEPVAARSLLEDILPRAAASEAPVPVADDNGRIIGFIDRTRLLQALAKGREP